MITTKKKYSTFGETLRALREAACLTLREVASNIGIDPSLLAKIERNKRQPTKQLIHALANFYNVDAQKLKNEFLSDQIAQKILSEKAGVNILKAAEEKVSYLKSLQA